MYRLKYKLGILNRLEKEFAEEVGITPEYFSTIQNGNKCSKVVAYCLTKHFDENLEILDLFEKVEE